MPRSSWKRPFATIGHMISFHKTCRWSEVISRKGMNIFQFATQKFSDQFHKKSRQDGMYATSQFAPRFLLALILLTRLIYSQNDPGLCLKTPELLPTGLFINTASHGGLYAYRRSHVLRPSDRHIGIELVNIQIRTLAKAKRARAPATLYPNSSLIFHPLIKLVHDVELNPGPQNFSVKESGGKNANSMKSEHISMRAR